MVLQKSQSFAPGRIVGVPDIPLTHSDPRDDQVLVFEAALLDQPPVLALRVRSVTAVSHLRLEGVEFDDRQRKLHRICDKAQALLFRMKVEPTLDLRRLQKERGSGLGVAGRDAGEKRAERQRARACKEGSSTNHLMLLRE